MTLARDPAEMTPEERLSEVAFHLAEAYLRALVSRGKALDQGHPAEAPCHQMVDAEESVTRKELY